MHDRHPTRAITAASCFARRSASSAITPGRILRFVVAVAEDRCLEVLAQVT
jgi:hypothetical protein